MKILFLTITILLLSLSTIAQTNPTGQCNLPINDSPKLFNFNLGLSSDEVSSILGSKIPSSELAESESTDIVDIVKVNGKYKEYWALLVKEQSVAISLSDKRETKYISVGVNQLNYLPEKDLQFNQKNFITGVSSMTFYFYENKLFKFSASFPEKNWTDEKELGLYIAKQFEIPSNFWKFDKYGGRINCGSFTISTSDLGESSSSAANNIITKGGLRRFLVSMENAEISKELKNKAIEVVLEKENRLLLEESKAEKQERHLNEYIVTTLERLDLYPEDYVGKNVYFRATPRNVERVREGMFSVGLSVGGISQYRSDLKYISSVYGKSGLNIVAYKGYPSWLDSYKSSDTLIGVTMSKEKSDYNEFYVGTMFDITSLFRPTTTGGYSDANTALIGRTIAETAIMPDMFEKNRFEDLFQNGADINIKDYKGRTPLILASQAKEGGNKRIKAFIEWGSKIDEIDNDGKTALIHATIAESKGIIKELLKANADKNIKDKSGKTALDYALGLEKSKDYIKLFQD